jgi:hypothetical protein
MWYTEIKVEVISTGCYGWTRWELIMNKSVASASGTGRKKRTPPMFDETVVASYVAKLNETLGDDRAFMMIFNLLINDEKVRHDEAVAIASGFVAPTAMSTTRAKALERILRRHQNLASFKLKQRAMAGRSAA